MDIKMIHCMLEKIAECAKCEMDEKGIEHINTKEFGEVADIIKDLSEALYYRTITVAMDDAEYGVDYNWEGRKGYDEWRYKSGRFAPKGRGMRMGYEEPPYYHMMQEDMEYMRDMDKKDMGKMYYAGDGKGNAMMGHSGSMDGVSRTETARRGYEETKMMSDTSPEGKKRAMDSLDHYMKELAEDMTSMVGKMDNAEKTLLKTKLQGLVAKLN